MAMHSSILALKISWTDEPSRLQSMGLQRVAHFTLFYERDLSTRGFWHPRKSWNKYKVGILRDDYISVYKVRSYFVRLSQGNLYS